MTTPLRTSAPDSPRRAGVVENNGVDVDAVLDSMLGSLHGASTNADVQEALERFGAAVAPFGPIDQAVARRGAINGLRTIGVKGVAALVDAAIAQYVPNGSGNGEPRIAEASTGVRVVPAPTRPLHVARTLVDHLYTTAAGLVLRDHRGDFYRYNGTCWPELDGRLVRADAYRWLEDAVYPRRTREGIAHEPWDPTRYKIDNVIDAMRAVVILDAGKPPAWSDGTADPPADEIVSMKNGLLHVPTRLLHEHSPRFFTHHSLPFAFDPAAPAPTGWLAFLDELWPDDPSSISSLQEVFGYILGGDTRQQKIFLLVGPRRGGKGTIGRVLTGLLGAHNVAAPTMAGIATNFGLQPLIGKPLGLISDARLSGRADGQVVVERLLSISGQDSLTIDRKYREPWTGRLPTRFVVLTNELPRLSDSSGALASRFVVFVLTKSFLGRENPALTDQLLAEAPGIFNWALAGLDRLNERGYFEAPDARQGSRAAARGSLFANLGVHPRVLRGGSRSTRPGGHPLERVEGLVRGGQPAPRH